MSLNHLFESCYLSNCRKVPSQSFERNTDFLPWSNRQLRLEIHAFTLPAVFARLANPNLSAIPSSQWNDRPSAFLLPQQWAASTSPSFWIRFILFYSSKVTLQITLSLHSNAVQPFPITDLPIQSILRRHFLYPGHGYQRVTYHRSITTNKRVIEWQRTSRQRHMLVKSWRMQTQTKSIVDDYDDLSHYSSPWRH